MLPSRLRLGSLLAATTLVLTPLAVATQASAPQASADPSTEVAASAPTRVHTDVDTTELVQPVGLGRQRAHRVTRHRHPKRRHHVRRARRAAKAGSGPAWTAMAPGVRWNPCRVISYKVNLAGAPADALAAVDQAFARVHAAGGLNFAYAGTTTKTSFTSANEYEDNTILIAWSTPARVANLAGAAVGVGGSAWRGNSYQHGGVVLEQGTPVASGFGNGATEGALLLHEIGHAIGLNHVNRRSEVMYPSVGPWSHGWYGAGDTAGLRTLGAAAGCTS